MNNNRWKERYTNAAGVDVTNTSKYVSINARGDGSRANPMFTTAFSGGYILSGGVFSNTTHGGVASNNITGQGMYSTFINNITLSIQGGAYGIGLKDIGIIGTGNFTSSNNSVVVNCLIDTIFKFVTVRQCVIKKNALSAYGGNNNSYLNLIDDGTKYHYINLSTFEGCELALTKTDIETTYKNNYLAFSNNKFKIGAETTYTALTGTTDAARRTNFVARCTAQGITPPTFTEYGETNTPMGRWLFTDATSIVDGQVIKGSTLAAWQLVRGIYLGYSSALVDRLPITTAKNIPSSFAASNPLDKVNVADNSITPTNQFDVLSRDTGRISSKIILIGDGVRQLNMLTVNNNFPAQFGVMLDSTSNLGTTAIILNTGYAAILPNQNYIIRSSDKQFASFKYKGTVYSTSLTTRNNILRVSAAVIATDITEVVGNPILYTIDDLAIQNTVRMRVVRDLPAPIITSGDLQEGYWYLVEANNAGDTGTVNYNNGGGSVAHPVGDSFLVFPNAKSFTITGNVHLRRCWRQDYTVASEVTDSAHWAARQKPLWFDVLPNDLRALNKYNLASDIEMKMDVNGNYISSGHPDFYSSISGDNGTMLPSYPITGVYMQIELLITSMNPM